MLYEIEDVKCLKVKSTSYLSFVYVEQLLFLIQLSIRTKVFWFYCNLVQH